MIYLSKGLALRHSGEILTVSHLGGEYELTGARAEVWERGRRGSIDAMNTNQFTAVCELAEQGLIETSADAGHDSYYRLLTNCVICPVKNWDLTISWSPLECTVWKWLTKAGLRLTIAELVFLIEQRINPSPNLLGDSNRQALTESIYTRETIFDGILESRMEQSPARDKTVNAVLSLLRRKKLILV